MNKNLKIVMWLLLLVFSLNTIFAENVCCIVSNSVEVIDNSSCSDINYVGELNSTGGCGVQNLYCCDGGQNRGNFNMFIVNGVHYNEDKCEGVGGIVETVPPTSVHLSSL